MNYRSSANIICLVTSKYVRQNINESKVESIDNKDNYIRYFGPAIIKIFKNYRIRIRKLVLDEINSSESNHRKDNMISERSSKKFINFQISDSNKSDSNIQIIPMNMKNDVKDFCENCNLTNVDILFNLLKRIYYLRRKVTFDNILYLSKYKFKNLIEIMNYILINIFSIRRKYLFYSLFYYSQNYYNFKVLLRTLNNIYLERNKIIFNELILSFKYNGNTHFELFINMIKYLTNLRRKDTMCVLRSFNMYKLTLIFKINRLFKILKDYFNIRRKDTLINLFTYLNEFYKNCELIKIIQKIIIDRRKRIFDDLITILNELKEEKDSKTTQKEKNINIIVGILKKIIFERRLNTFNEINNMKYDDDFLNKKMEILKFNLDNRFKDMPLFDGISF